MLAAAIYETYHCHMSPPRQCHITVLVFAISKTGVLENVCAAVRGADGAAPLLEPSGGGGGGGGSSTGDIGVDHAVAAGIFSLLCGVLYYFPPHMSSAAGRAREETRATGLLPPPR